MSTTSVRSSSAGAWTAAALVMVLCLVATFTLRTPNSSGNQSVASGGGGGRISSGGAGADAGGDQLVGGAAGSAGSDVAGTNGSGSGGGASGGGTGTAGGAGGKAGLAGTAGKAGTAAGAGGGDCAKGKNAGNSDTGVTSTEIRFAATVVKSGIAKDFLSDAQYGMEAVRNKVNRQGGICGRQITIDYKDDGWDQTTGQRYIQDFIGEKKYFGLAVNPSSEGLRGAIDSGLIDQSKFPVVGSDGMLKDQYGDPWVWPVATSTASVMRIMAANAAGRGAHKFGIVWDSHYRFGVEGHDAFKSAVAKAGGSVTSDQGVDGTQGDFSNQAKQFVQDCGGTSLSNCDFIAMLLEPAAASAWVGPNDRGLGDGQHRPAVGIGVPQPLFVNSFANDCGAMCANMWAWTSFKPPLDPFKNEPAVQAYSADLLQASRSADANNPHVQGAYVGMLLLVDALQKLGAAPTRDGIRQVLDSESLTTGLADTINFKQGNHFGNIKAQAFEDTTQGSSFQNWRYTNSGFLADSNPGG